MNGTYTEGNRLTTCLLLYYIFQRQIAANQDLLKSNRSEILESIMTQQLKGHLFTATEDTSYFKVKIQRVSKGVKTRRAAGGRRKYLPQRKQMVQ